MVSSSYVYHDTQDICWTYIYMRAINITITRSAPGKKIISQSVETCCWMSYLDRALKRHLQGDWEAYGLMSRVV